MKFVFAFDGKMVQHLAVTLLSLFEAHPDLDLEVFFILFDVSNGDVNRIRTLCRQFSHVTAYFQPYAIDQPERFPITGHISLAAYARVFLTDLLPAHWSRVIYLDCDLIIRHSLAEIWDVDLEGFAGAGVREPGTERHADLDIPAELPYINSGVLLINLSYWRSHGVRDILLSFIERHPEKLRYWDQDAINACLHRDLRQLPDRWNVTHTFYLGPYHSLTGIKGSALLKLQRDPAVVHFSGATKPWMYIMTHPFQEQYWALLARTPFAHVAREPKTVRSFLYRHVRLVHRNVKRSLFLAVSILAERSGELLTSRR